MKYYPDVNPIYLQVLDEMPLVFSSYNFVKRLRVLYGLDEKEIVNNHKTSKFLLHRCTRLSKCHWQKNVLDDIKPVNQVAKSNDLTETEMQMIKILNQKGYVVLKPSFLS
jgi:hypothetical protein